LAPLQGVAIHLPRRLSRALHSLARVGTRIRQQALLSLLLLLSACSSRVSCVPSLCHPKAASTNHAEQKVPASVRKSARGVQRPQRTAPWRNPLAEPRAEAREPARNPAQLRNLPGVFHPSNALELSPSGLCPAQRGPHVSVSLPPMLLERELSLSPQLRRVEPSAQCEPLPTAPKRNRQRLLGPLGVLPSEALPPAVAEPTSRLFLSRASAAEADRAPQSVTACGSVSDPNPKVRVAPAPMGFST
jgi:hypothetical protein